MPDLREGPVAPVPARAYSDPVNCCGPHKQTDPNGLNVMFSGRYLAQELAAFRRRGLDRRQTFMLAALAGAERVLDIGCGIGPLGLSALRRGARSALLVEASAPSLKVAGELARELGVEERAELLLADGAHLPDSASGDAVVLDRVVCCYPDASTLLERAAALSAGTLVFSHPPSTWWMRSAARLGNLAMRLFGREYRLFVHDEDELLEHARTAGHELVSRRSFGVWKVEVLARAPGGAAA